MDQSYERRRARLLAAIAEHERGDLDHAGLQAALADLQGSLDHAHPQVRQAVFEADVALENARDGRPLDPDDTTKALRRMRRNLREALG